jgi:hypothetical protein
MLKIPHFLDNRLTDGGKVVSLRTGRGLLPRNIILLLLVLISIRGWVNQGLVLLEGLGKMKECTSIHLIGTRTRDLPACSIVPEPLRFRVLH